MTALRVDVDQVELTQLSELAWTANDPTLRYAAITALAVLAGERARVALTSLLDHQDEAVNARAQSALQGLPRVLK
jgi:HEAT repeat protein